MISSFSHQVELKLWLVPLVYHWYNRLEKRIHSKHANTSASEPDLSDYYLYEAIEQKSSFCKGQLPLPPFQHHNEDNLRFEIELEWRVGKPSIVLIRSNLTCITPFFLRMVNRVISLSSLERLTRTASIFIEFISRQHDAISNDYLQRESREGWSIPPRAECRHAVVRAIAGYSSLQIGNLANFWVHFTSELVHDF